MRKRLALLLSLAPGISPAWEFAASPVCMLSHSEPGLEITLTYDPRHVQAYTIFLSRAAGWPVGDVFSVTFDGPRGLTISTRNHQINGGTLSVSDRGFDNVLDGLEYNLTATAQLGTDRVQTSLSGAAPAVRAFRDCAAGGLA